MSHRASHRTYPWTYPTIATRCEAAVSATDAEIPRRGLRRVHDCFMKFRFGRSKEPPDDWAVGSRVRVRQDPDFPPGPWPSEPTGRIAAAPDGRSSIEVDTRQGIERTWWVVFDEPQLDTDGDRPYCVSQVLERYLQAPELWFEASPRGWRQIRSSTGSGSGPSEWRRLPCRGRDLRQRPGSRLALARRPSGCRSC